MMSEIWTAKEEIDGMVHFEVLDEETGKTRTEQKYKAAIPLMLMFGGYDATMAALMQVHPYPWRFCKVGENIYLDGKSIGVPGYHDIE